MFVIDLDGNEYNLLLTGNVIARGKHRSKRSDLHVRARRVLQKIFPTCVILEELEIIIRGKERRYLDFYLPLVTTAIEVQGEQHFTYIPYFHHNKVEFLRQLRRDKEKVEWCKLNNMKLYLLKYNQSDEEWETIINER